MAVVGEFVEAQVGLHGETPRGGRRRNGDGAVQDAVRVGRSAADGITIGGDAEQHDAADASRDGLVDECGNGVERVLRDSGHARDRLRGVDALLDEDGQDELARREVVLGDEAAERWARAQSARTARGECGHGVSSRS